MPSDIKYIAVVDDHIMVRKGLCALINMLDQYKVLFEADNGLDMISKINDSQLPALILLDITMPKMDGYDTAHWLKTHYPQIRVMALSTLDKESAIIKMIKNGAHGYILKDADPEELKLGIDSVLANGFYYNENVVHKILHSLSFIEPEMKSPVITPELTPRETEFLELACSERSYPEIAREMSVSLRTVDGYRETLFKKFGVSSRIGIVLHAIKHKLISL